MMTDWSQLYSTHMGAQDFDDAVYTNPEGKYLASLHFPKSHMNLNSHQNEAVSYSLDKKGKSLISML